MVKQTSVAATQKNILLWRRFFREIPAGHVDQHHNQVEANIPELGGKVLASLKEIIELNSLVAAFRRSTLVVHQMPLIAFPRWGGIEDECWSPWE